MCLIITHLRLVRVVDEGPFISVEDKPALVPCFDPGSHLLEVAPAAAAVEDEVATQLDLNRKVSFDCEVVRS